MAEFGLVAGIFTFGALLYWLVGHDPREASITVSRRSLATLVAVLDAILIMALWLVIVGWGAEASPLNLLTQTVITLWLLGRALYILTRPDDR